MKTKYFTSLANGIDRMKYKMKQLLLNYCIFLMYLPLNAQIKVDAGNDIIVCAFSEEEYVLGGFPSASGGVEPYTYTWSGKHFDLKYPTGIPSWIYASDILDDTTKSNPIITEWRNVPDEWTTYYLMVEDAEGNVQADSVRIIRSYFGVKTILILPVTINKGDSIELIGDPYFFSNFLPVEEYILSPTHGLSDSTDIYGWAKPDTSITYYLEAVNSAGCRSGKIEYWHIEVTDTTKNQQNKLVQEGKLWSNTIIPSMPGEYRSYWIKFEGDTLINDLNYKKVLRADDSLHSEWYLGGFIREDTANQKVYLYNDYSQEDMLLYDFSLETGDSILTFTGARYAKVDTVLYKPFGNSTDSLKQICFFGSCSNRSWIEGIGSLSGIIEGLELTVGGTPKLVCYYENNNLIYRNPDFETCFPEGIAVSVSMLKNKKDIEIFPNPARDKITLVSPPEQTITEIKLYNLTGTCLYSNTNVGSNLYELQTGRFPGGSYILKISNGKEVVTKKIVLY